VPLASGMFLKSARKAAAIAGTLVAVTAFVTFAAFEITYMHNNPAFLAAMGMTGGAITFALVQWALPRRVMARAPERSAVI
jgi:hypothetical protein